LAAGTEDIAYIINSSTLLAGVTDSDGPFPLTMASVTVVSKMAGVAGKIMRVR